MVWDRGTFQLEGDGDALKQLERGEIKFSLNGEKLHGSFVLVKLKTSQKGSEWLMIKHKDAAVDPNWNIDDHDGSVLTGRVLDEIKAEEAPQREPSPLHAAELEGAKKAAMPTRMGVMLATLSDRPFSDPHWLFEIKWDGVRALAFIENGGVKLRARSGSDITSQYPELHALPGAFSGKQAILGMGKLRCSTAAGTVISESCRSACTCVTPLQRLISEYPVVYFVFDLLYCDGYDLRGAPLRQRKQLLQRLLHGSGRFSATPTISWKKEKSCSNWRSTMSWKESSPNASTAATSANAAPTG